MEKLHTGRYIVDLTEDIKDILNDNNDSDDLDDYYFEIDDEEWGNDFYI